MDETFDGPDEIEPKGVTSLARYRVPAAHGDGGDPAPFPASVIPEPSRSFIQEVATAIGVPTDFVGVPLLTAAGTTLGRSRRLMVTETWSSYGNLFAAVVGGPGSGKSPALGQVTGILTELQAEAITMCAASTRKAGEAPPAPDQPTVAPKRDHLFTTDATFEVIAPLLESSAGLLMLKDELVGFVRSMNQYRNGNGADRQGWLSMWSCEALKIDRVNREGIFIQTPVVGVLGGLQPGVLADLAGDAAREDGFFERFLIAYPNAKPMRLSRTGIRKETKAGIVDQFRRLRQAKPLFDEVELAPDAFEAFKAWHDLLQEEAFDTGGRWGSFLSKLCSQAARLALILHALSDPDGSVPDIDVPTMTNAIKLAEYFRSHAERVRRELASSQTALQGAAKAVDGVETRIVRLLRKTGGWIPRTEFTKACHNKVKSDDLSAILSVLEQEGVAERRVNRNTGGKPAEEWRWLERANEETASENARAA